MQGHIEREKSLHIPVVDGPDPQLSKGGFNFSYAYFENRGGTKSFIFHVTLGSLVTFDPILQLPQPPRPSCTIGRPGSQLAASYCPRMQSLRHSSSLGCLAYLALSVVGTTMGKYVLADPYLPWTATDPQQTV